MEFVPISVVTHGVALALAFALGAVFGAFILFFTRRRERYFQAVVAVAFALTALYWFTVRPSLETAGRPAHEHDPVFDSSDGKHKPVDRAGRFSRKARE